MADRYLSPPAGFSFPHHANQSSYYPGNLDTYATFGQPQLAPEMKQAVGFVQGQRRRLNFVPILVSLIVPCVLFSLVFALMSFSLHYQKAPLCFLFVFLCLLVVVAIGLFAADAAKKKMAKEGGREPTWLFFIAATSLLAWVLGMAAGDVNFVENLQPFYDIMNLNIYPSVDPGEMRGQMLMDAGRIMFTPGTRLDLQKSMGFKNDDVYCVAPIARSNASKSEQMDSYDFWAVGVNCCSGNRPDFHCGQFANVHARAGLRLMRDEQRPFFRLAVQQAEAAYDIKAVHPLFFTWMQDPVAEVNAFQDDGMQCFLLGVFSFCALQFFLVASATVAFARLGKI